MSPTSRPSFLTGPTDPRLWNITLGEMLKKQADTGPSRQCLVFPEFGQRSTYMQLHKRSLAVSKGLIASGIRRGDNVGIFAGNSPPYVELLFASSHIGAALVVFNCAYTSVELKAAIEHSGMCCKIVFTAPTIGKLSNDLALDMIADEISAHSFSELEEIIMLRPVASRTFSSYEDFISRGKSIPDSILQARRRAVSPDDVCNLQFTSGTTGNPKAAMLTHNNIINDGRFVGDRMRLKSSDIICCPPPLFHCFGLVLGLLAALTHGSSIVFPSETFNAAATLQAVVMERCTALHGVPAMFSALLELLEPNMDFSKLRTGIAAGAPVPRKMMVDLQETLNLREITNTYGMTETSPASFMTFTDDPVEKRLSTVGKILPHMKAKIVDAKGEILPIGCRGELCVAGFALQKGYWRNPEKTAESMITDDDGIRWMHTGDEAVFDEGGYCRITGRIKDIIIRGGENIFPLEIEERLVQHPSIVQASVVGIADNKYGEIVCAFLQHRSEKKRPSLKELREFVRLTLGWHKAPMHVFWLAEGEDFPKTGSGKIKKHDLKVQGEQRAKLERLAKSKL
ncbi:hypothetical protein W97_02362 [Coniosporium apollinis CBS 100218]|uniref:Long-chain acyl-CoA synthetase n=1 Tax=Coniosporium apollinis (strain CBS 100218) TaxID=1168221 RepID=R7YMJ3_CONA1|nr:uncharacterized protein W97_02362 [Coniosporium apollinis CBS 100218]EON63135.1 hypothetical protein W97_02362 [Coniosporium apollinis CBS 100218]